MLRKNQILIMDEATASVDLHTDRLIQDTLESEIQERGATVVTIAHRILTSKLRGVLLLLLSAAAVGCCRLLPAAACCCPLPAAC